MNLKTAGSPRISPDGRFIVFTAEVYPDCPAFSEQTAASEGSDADRCNRDRDKAAAESKVKAQIFTHLLYRHWNHYTGAKRSHLFYVTVAAPSPTTLLWRDLTPHDPHDVPPFSIEGGGGFDISPDSKELAFTENPDPEPATSVSAQIYTLDLMDAGAKPVKISTSAGAHGKSYQLELLHLVHMRVRYFHLEVFHKDHPREFA